MITSPLPVQSTLYTLDVFYYFYTAGLSGQQLFLCGIELNVVGFLPALSPGDYHHDYKEMLEGSGSTEKEECFACVIWTSIVVYACSQKKLHVKLVWHNSTVKLM